MDEENILNKGNESDRLKSEKREVAKRLNGGRVIPRMLAALGLIAMVGCGNVENPVNPPPAVLVQEMMDNPPDVTKPITKKVELPADVVSPEELAEKYHTKIWNLPDIKLHLRQKALENESVFQDILTGNVESLDVVLLDGPYIHTRFMNEEQRANLPELVDELQLFERRERFKREKYFEAQKPKMQEVFNQRLGELEKKIRSGELKQEEFELQKDILKEGMRPFLEGPTEDDLNATNAIGIYVRALRFKEATNPQDDKVVQKIYILLALKEVKMEELKSGNVKVYMKKNLGGFTLNPDQSFPDPSKYHINPKDDIYPVGGQSSGFALRHEFAHHNYGHPQADWVPLEGIKKAYQAYRDGDDSLYYFVFETPDGNIYTRTRTPVEQPAI